MESGLIIRLMKNSYQTYATLQKSVNLASLINSIFGKMGP